METAILILKDTLEQQEKQLREAREFQKQKGESLIITKAIENLTKVIAELMYAIYILRRASAKTSDESSALPIPDVIKSVCPSCESGNCCEIKLPMNRCNDCGVEWQTGL